MWSNHFFEPRIDIILSLLTVYIAGQSLPISVYFKYFLMKIYVSNLDFGVQNEDLAELFAAYGTVISANIINDRATGRSRGFGFVEMDNNEEATAAISNLNDSTFNGRQLRVSEAQDKPEKSFNKGGGFKGNNSYSRNSW